ncbi:MAG: 3-deoxy-D-manno-octulosonic acid transferase, partial [Micavibrio aeruginosavorus]
EKITRAGLPLLEVLLALRLRRGKEDPLRTAERRGRPSLPRPLGKLAWIHAASVGEAQSALILIHALAKAHPDIRVLVTSGTVTSAALMNKRLPSFAFHQYVPLDHPAWVQNFLDYWKPDLALWMESELWPNLLMSLKKRGIPAALVNARLSDKSFSNWMKAKNSAAQIIGCFNVILTQTEKDASHYRALGAKNVIVTDNIKYSAEPLPFDEAALSALKVATDNRPMWVYASTHAGEEDLACRAHKQIKEKLPNLLTILVPRHPERREEVANTCFENSVKFRLRGQSHILPSPDDDVYIADTLGELGLFYTLSPIAMIGRSFSNDGGGGHNPVEAAQMGCAVLTGPNNQNQRQLYDDMQADSAVIETKDEFEFTAILEELLTHQAKLETMQAKSAVFVARKTHVVETVLANITPLLTATESRHAA